jgi:hypothetical protein
VDQDFANSSTLAREAAMEADRKLRSMPSASELLDDPARAWGLRPDQARGILPAVAALVAVLQARAAAPEPQELIAGPSESPPSDGDSLLTPEQVAVVLAVEVDAVARLCRRFRRKLGHRTYRYLKSGVDALMRGGA